MATKEELIAARDAVWDAEPSLHTKGQAERIAAAALDAAEKVRAAANITHAAPENVKR